MKKILLMSGFLLAIQSFCFAQLSLRPQVGVNFASFTNELLDEEWSSKVGYQFGVDLQIGSRFYVQPGINFQSTRLTFEGVEEVSFSTTRLNVPVMVGYKFVGGDGGALGFRAFAGPNLAMHMGESFDEAIEGLSADDFKSAQIGVMAGAGLDISILFVDIAYKFGLSDVVEIENVNEDTGKNIFSINAGIRIGF